MKFKLLPLFLLLITPVAAIMGASVDEAREASLPRRWTASRAWAWYEKQPWIVGFNYVPSTAANTTEFWSAETFDEKTIDRELGWGAGLGFNSCRVFVQYLVWKHDPAGLKQRLDRFLALASKHGLTTTLVLFDDCAFGDPPQTEPYLGKQRDPIPGMILPSWTPSPGLKAVSDRSVWPDLECYIKDIVRAFGQDSRVLMWDLYNEPGNSGMGSKSLPLVEATFAWARAVSPSQPLTMSPWGALTELGQRQVELSDVVSFHFYGNADGLRGQIANYKKHLRPVINTEWMARPKGSKWTDLPLFKQEAVGCYSWGLVNGRTQCQFAWNNKRGTPEPEIWFHDLFHKDGRPYDPAEHDVIRQTTAGKAIDWSTAGYSRPHAAANLRPRMLFGDATRHGRPFAKDPSVLRLNERYLMYYSMAPSTNQTAPKGWAIGIAESRDLVDWKKVGEILPEQPCEQNGLVNGKALFLGGKVHLFYNTYGNGTNDALCHATSDDGLKFTRDPSNPVLHPTGDWNSGRAIDCDAFGFGGKLWLIYATRDPSMKTQMLVTATADLNSDFGRAAWTPVGDGPILKPELAWETRCIEAPSVIQRGDTLYLFYGGGYNNDPQQIGCATSTDGRTWTRLFREPLIPNGQPGDWNTSETGHPGIFTDTDGRTYLFVQGNNDKGRTWFLSAYEIGWQGTRPTVLWDSTRFPMKRPGSAAPELNRFHAPYKLNRYILTKSDDTNAFDSVYATCPFVFSANGRFYMTYVGHDGIGYQSGLAESDDLVNWKKLGLIIARDPASKFRRYSIGLTSILRENELSSAGALKKVNGRYLGSWLAFPQQGHEAGPAVIGLAWSDDLKNWDLSDPILRPEEGASWERGGLYKSYLMESDGVYYIFYNAKNTPDRGWREQTGVATSRDLKRWTRSPGNPLIPNGPKGSFDERFASDPVVMRSGAQWALFYFGLAADNHARELLALSPDLLQVDKVSEALLDIGEVGAIDDRHAHKPCVITWRGDLYHFYDAVSNKVPGGPTRAVRGISVARSRPW